MESAELIEAPFSLRLRAACLHSSVFIYVNNLMVYNTNFDVTTVHEMTKSSGMEKATGQQRIKSSR